MTRQSSTRLRLTHKTIATDIGPLTLTEEDGSLISVSGGTVAESGASPLLQEAAGQIEAYLRGALTSFSIPLKPSGTVFQSRIWALMQDIPYGETCTYNDLAQLAGSAARAVGTACGANPILLMIPCHRVVGKAGVTGYSGPGGVVTKQLLLDLEKAAPLRARSLSENGPAHAEPHAAEPIMSARRSA